MSRRLTLDTTGIKGPLDVGATTAEDPPSGSAPEAISASAPARAQASARPRRRTAARPRLVATDPSRRPSADTPFYGTGRPQQTSVAISRDLAQQLAELKHATGASIASLAVASIHAGLPVDGKQAAREIADERLRRLDVGERVEHNLRLPARLRARVDELARHAHEQNPRSTRADLVNAALRAGLPQQPGAAADLVREHARQVERAHAPAD